MGSAYCWSDDVCPPHTMCIDGVCCYACNFVFILNAIFLICCSDGQLNNFGECHHTEHRCTLGGCIARSRLCDTHVDCPDGSDELHCGMSIYVFSTLY